MIYLFLSIIYFIKYGYSKSSISSIFFLLLLFSSIAAILTGRLIELPITYFFYELYIGVLLFILFLSWNSYSQLKNFDFSDVDSTKIEKAARITSYINLFIFVVNGILFVAVFTLLSSEMIDVGEYKNGGGAADFFATIAPSYVFTLSYLLSPFGYYSMALHFYYLLLGRIKKSIFHLILSINLILVGLLALSRSALVNYVMIYMIIFMFLTPIIAKRYLKRVSVYLLIAAFSVGFVFSTISESRFGEKYNIESEPLIDVKEYPLLVSILDYYSQWEYYGPLFMEKYQIGKIYWGMYNSCGLGVLIEQKIYGSEKLRDERDNSFRKYMGDDISAFHGLVARSIFDFGYLGTILFILINCKINRWFSPDSNRNVRFYTIMALPLILPFTVGFYSGNAYGSLDINMGMIYMFLIYKYCKVKKYERINN